MDDISVQMILFLVAFGFVGGFVDSVVGGGGLISLPALLFTGMPPSLALGTNKLAGTMCSLTSMIAFFKSGKINVGLVKYLVPLSLIGSAAGVFVVRLIPSESLKPIVIVMLILVTIYTMFKKNWGDTPTYTGLTKKVLIISTLTAFGLGFYDGFFGPGTGSFLLFIFLMLGFDFVGAAANGKVLNFASNIAALVTFAALDMINYSYGLVVGIGMVIGAVFGSRVAIRKGAAYVKPLFIGVTTLLVGKQLWDMLS